MKKITLLFCLLSISISFGQLLSEDFEGGLVLPAGWTNNDIEGEGEIWTFETGGEAVGFTDPNTIYYDVGLSGNYAIFDSDGYGNGPPPGPSEDAALESPSFDCTGLTNVTLTYNHFFTSGFGGAGFVEVYNGSTWVQVASYSASLAFGLEFIDVSSELAGVSNAQVRFRWTGDFSWGWAVDDVTVFECTDSTPNPVITPGPADGAIDVVLDNSDIDFPNRIFFTWADGAGDPGFSYTLNLGETSPPTENSFAGFQNGDFIFNLLDNTTYFWSIESTNCAGTSTPTIWSFTTGTPLSIEDNELNLIKVYPNPVKDIIKIDTNLTIDTVIIVNQLGQNVMQLKGEQINNNEVNLSKLSNGLYFMNISSEGKSQTLKIIKE